MKCPKCNRRIDKDIKFCPMCGTRIPKSWKKQRKQTKWIALVAILLMVILISGWFLGTLVAQILGSGSKQESIEIHSVEEAIIHAKQLGAELGYENAMSEMTEKVTTEIDGDCYYRLQQNYNGIPVYGRSVVYSTDEKGKVCSITGNTLDVGGDLDIRPTLTYVQATALANSYLQSELGLENIISNFPTEKMKEIYIFTFRQKSLNLSMLFSSVRMKSLLMQTVQRL